MTDLDYYISYTRENSTDFYTAPEEGEKSAEAWNRRVEKAGILKNYYNLTVEEVREHFKYSGGDGNRGCDASYNTVSAGRHLRYWRLTRGEEPPPVHRNQCVCGVKIVENCFIVDTRDIDLIVTVGNCCIERFCSVDKAGRTCDKCGGPHRNSKYNLCNECKPPAGWIKCEECNEPCRKRDNLCETHKMIKGVKETEERDRQKEEIAEKNRIKQEKAEVELTEWILKQKIERDKERERELRMSMMDDDERKCDCGKLITRPYTQCYNCKKGIDPNATRPCETCNRPVKGGYKTCYNCNNGIDPNATHPCETCEKPVKGTFKKCFLCNQKLRQEKG